MCPAGNSTNGNSHPPYGCLPEHQRARRHQMDDAWCSGPMSSDQTLVRKELGLASAIDFLSQWRELQWRHPLRMQWYTVSHDGIGASVRSTRL